MNYAATLCLVLLAAYGVASVLLSVFVVVAWRAGFERKSLTSGRLLALRLLPGAGSLFLTLVVVLPAFWINEPTRSAEPVGPLLSLLAAFALAEIGAALWRAYRGWRDAATLVHTCCRSGNRRLIAGRRIDIIDRPEAMVAVIGVWRPRIVAATAVLAACDGDELHAIVDHEAAHIAAHDNLKVLLAIACPDILAWTSVGAALIARWRLAVEFDADARATGSDRHKRVALASALIKVARLPVAKRQIAELSMPIAVDDVDCRVRRLLEPLRASACVVGWKPMLALALLSAMGAMAVEPHYGAVQDMIEAVVAFGR